MGSARAPGPVKAEVIRKQGDPFETELHEGGAPPVDPVHIDLLNRIFYNSSVDLGAVVKIGDAKYICTRVGWRSYPG